MDKMWKSFFQIVCTYYITAQQTFVYITSQHNKFLYTGYFSHILHLDIKSTSIESENEQNPYNIIWFSMGIDHSNPYIHSTIVLCDRIMAQ